MKTWSTAVVIRGLVKRYGDVTALDGIDLDVAEAASMRCWGPTALARLHVPQQIVFATVQPIMIVLMFRYVLGGAIEVPGPGRGLDRGLLAVFVLLAAVTVRRSDA